MAIERRVLGVLVEKAKTTPEGYPLSLNALVTGCNQKSNRSPQMNVAADDVEEVLDRLREESAVAEVMGGGRVAKYRHYMKDWMGVDGNELAVMAELILRGPQTVGQLRGRAARMGPIADLNALRPILKSLTDKGLVIAITPEGRGQVVTHALYPRPELDSLCKQYTSGVPVEPAAPPVRQEPAPGVEQSEMSPDVISQLRAEMAQIRDELAKLHKQVESLWDRVR